MGIDFRLIPQLREQPDVPLLSKDVRSFRMGVNNKSHPIALADTEAVQIVNFLLKQGAMAERRSGTTNVMNAVEPIAGESYGLGYWNPPDSPPIRKLFSATAEGFWSWDGSGTWTRLTGGAPVGTEPVILVQATRTDPTFENVSYIIQKDSDQVLEWKGGAAVTTVSGGASGSLSSIPSCKDGLSWLGRLWVAEDKEFNGYIRYSEFGKPTNFDLGFGFLISPEDELVRMVQWFNAGILCFFRNSIWVLGIDQANFGIEFFDNTQIETLNYDIGCVARNAVAQAGQDFFFLSRFGVHRLSKTTQDMAIGLSVPISDKIETIIDRINWPYADKASAVVWDNFYMLAVPIDSSQVNNIVLVYDLRDGAWTTIEGWNPADWQLAHFDFDEDKLYFATSSVTGEGKVYEALDEVTGTDDGVDVTATIDTPRYDFGTTSQRKQFRWIDVFTDGSIGGDLTVYVATENNVFQSLGTITISPSVPVLPQILPFNLADTNLQRDRFYLDGLGHPTDIQFRFESIGDDLIRILYFTIDAHGSETEYS